MTDPKSEIVGLAERCEKATGPDRELDYAIADAALGPVREPYVRGKCETYTASIDAAMTLVPEGYGRMVSDHVFGGAVAELRPGGYKPGGEDTFDSLGRAPTWPLALCAAALRARATLKEHK